MSTSNTSKRKLQATLLLLITEISHHPLCSHLHDSTYFEMFWKMMEQPPTGHESIFKTHFYSTQNETLF